MDAYLWDSHGIFLHFLPTCSPKLNPIKLLWNILATRLRYIPCMENGNHSHRVVHAAFIAMNAFTHDNLERHYSHDNYI
jgi:hypothetical protein